MEFMPELGDVSRVHASFRINMQHKGNLASIAASGVCSALVEDLSKLHATMRSFPPHFTRNHYPKCNEVEASYQKTSVLQEETRKKDRRT